MSDANRVRKGFILAAVLYAILFVGHILAAANDWDFLFRLMASIITIQTFFVGASIALLGSAESLGSKVRAHRLGYAISLPLSAGLAYAYASQSIDVALTLAFLGTTTLTHGFIIRRLNRMMEEKVD